MRIAPGIHLAASGGAGFSLTDALDCNTWLLDTGDGLALFDSGAGRDIPALLAEIEAGGLDPAQLRHIFLTHAHADHSGGVAPLLDRMPRLTLHAGREAAARMASHDETRISLDTARRFGVYPEAYRWRGATVHNVMADGEVARIGAAEIQLLETPGHSADECTFLVRLGERVILIPGDTIFAGGKVVLQDIADCSVAATLASIRRLATLEFSTFLPGHGVFSLRDGKAHVLRGKGFADMGLAPPSFF